MSRFVEVEANLINVDHIVRVRQHKNYALSIYLDNGNVINPTTASRPGKRCRSKKSPVSPPTKRLASVTKIDSTTVETTLVLYRGLVMISR